jgi:hypothetical protein
MAVEIGETHGPSVRFEPLAEPLPEIPFPNDIGLRVNDDTAGGVSWNVSLERPSRHEQRLRQELNGLDGFGPFAPFVVSFDGPLDLATVGPESLMLINIEPGHPREGERIPLELGQGYLPIAMEPTAYFGMDLLASAPDLLFPLDNQADMDGDGVFERATFYDVSSHTLLVYPLIPLAPGARHAVLLTREIQGSSVGAGELALGPIRSPFPFKAHAAQHELVRRAVELAGIGASELAFGWTYTPSDVREPMARLREGLYGKGALGWLAEVAPAGITVRDTDIAHDAQDLGPGVRDHRFILRAEFLQDVLGALPLGGDAAGFDVGFDHIDYAVFGSFTSPELRVGSSRQLDLSTHTGEGKAEVGQVPFMLLVPRTTVRHQPPFPVVFYAHGTGSSRVEALAVADALARQGIAVLSFDLVGHGPIVPDLVQLRAQSPDQAAIFALLPTFVAQLMAPDRVDEIGALPFEEALEELAEIGLWAELAVHGRREDPNQNGFYENAEGFYHADPFKTCSSFWQDTVDLMQIVKIIRSFNPETVPAETLAEPTQATESELAPYLAAGDFNADGVLDIGGPDVPFGIAGTSLGGMHAVLGAAVEPEITTATPIVAGAGLTAIMVRSTLRFVVERVLLDVFGNLVVGCPSVGGTVYLSQGNDAAGCNPSALVATGFGTVAGLAPGDRIRLVNRTSGAAKEGRVNNLGGFAIGVVADRGDALELVLTRSGGSQVNFELTARFEGSAYQRNTKDFLRAVVTLQHVLDRCDPGAFAPHLIQDRGAFPPANTLMLNAVGDTTVPISAGIQLALAAGFLGTSPAVWQPRLAALKAAGTIDSGHLDVDDVHQDNPPDAPGLGPTPAVPSATGESALRLFPVEGTHAFIAGYTRDGFSWSTYAQNMLAVYHRCQGRVVPDGPLECLANQDCPLLDQLPGLLGCPELR